MREIEKREEKEEEKAAAKRKEDRDERNVADKEARTKLSRDRFEQQKADKADQREKDIKRRERAKNARLQRIAKQKKASIERSRSKVQSGGIRNIQKINKDEGDATATRKMADNLGQVGAGLARVGANALKVAGKGALSAPDRARAALSQRRQDVKDGIVRKRFSRIGDAKDKASEVASSAKSGAKRAIRRGALATARAVGPSTSDKRIEPVRVSVDDRKALPPAVDGRYRTKPSGAGKVDVVGGGKERSIQVRSKNAPIERDSKPETKSQTKPKGLLPSKSSATSDYAPKAERIAAFKKRRDQLRKAGANMREELIYEVEDMKKEKVDKVIDIMRGKNKIEVNPKVNESHLLVQDLADYKPLEIETIDLIKPEPLKASNWRNEISEEDKKIISINKKKRLDAKKQAFKDMVDEPYETDDKKRKEYGKKLLDRLTKVDEGAAWTKKEGKNKSGGLNEKGRKSYERENPGSDLKAPSKKVGNPRRKSFCARMRGMKKKLTSKKTASDPNSRINKSLRAWNC